MTVTLTQQQAKDFARLHQKKHREAAGQLLIEGERLVTDALASASQIDALIVQSGKESQYAELLFSTPRRGGEVHIASAKMCEKLSDTPHPQGIFAVLPLPRTDPSEAIAAAADGLPLFALHGAADPGNIGTIMRTTEWFGGAALLLSDDSVDPFNSKVLRSSMGSLFRLRLGRYSSLEWLAKAAAKHGRTLVATTADGGVAPRAYPNFASSIILLGSEAHGLSSEALAAISRRVTIPGNGAESLNLAMAHAVLAYEASLR